MTKIYPPTISTTEWTESTYASIKKGRHVFAVCKPKDGIIHESEWVELGKWLGDFSGELVGVQIQADQILQFTQFLWDLTIEIVPVQLPANRSPLSQSRSTPHLNYRKKNLQLTQAHTGIWGSQGARAQGRGSRRYWSSPSPWNICRRKSQTTQSSECHETQLLN